jgi:hypothetical protein
VAAPLFVEDGTIRRNLTDGTKIRSEPNRAVCERIFWIEFQLGGKGVKFQKIGTNHNAIEQKWRPFCENINGRG